MFEDSQACASMNQISCCCILKCFSAGESQRVLSCRCGNTVVVLLLILPLYNNSRLTLRKEYGGSPDDGHSLHLWICKAGSINFVSQPHTGMRGVIYTCGWFVRICNPFDTYISAWHKNCQWTLSISFLSRASIVFAPHLACWDVICLVLICIFIQLVAPQYGRCEQQVGGMSDHTYLLSLTSFRAKERKKNFRVFRAVWNVSFWLLSSTSWPHLVTSIRTIQLCNTKRKSLWPVGADQM